MNPTQAAARQTIFSSPVKPRVIDAKSYTGSSSVTFNVPQSPGDLCIAIIYSSAGAAAPTLPTGFTNLASQAFSGGTNGGTRVCYKFLNGSEAATLSSTVSAGNMIAFILLIKGAISSRAPTVSTVVNATTATPDPGAVTVTAPVTQALIIATFASSSNGLPTQLPTGFLYSNSLFADVGNSGFCTWSVNNCVSSFNPSAFTIPLSSITSSYTIAVRTA